MMIIKGLTFGPEYKDKVKMINNPSYNYIKWKTLELILRLSLISGNTKLKLNIIII